MVGSLPDRSKRHMDSRRKLSRDSLTTGRRFLHQVEEHLRLKGNEKLRNPGETFKVGDKEYQSIGALPEPTMPGKERTWTVFRCRECGVLMLNPEIQVNEHKCEPYPKYQT